MSSRHVIDFFHSLPPLPSPVSSRLPANGVAFSPYLPPLPPYHDHIVTYGVVVRIPFPFYPTLAHLPIAKTLLRHHLQPNAPPAPAITGALLQTDDRQGCGIITKPLTHIVFQKRTLPAAAAILSLSRAPPHPPVRLRTRLSKAPYTTKDIVSTRYLLIYLPCSSRLACIRR